MRFGTFVYAADKQTRVFEKIAEERSRPAITDRNWALLFEIIIQSSVFRDLHLSSFKAIISIFGQSQFRITRHGVAQFLFARLERCPALRIKQAGKINGLASPIVLDADNFIT